ncbi:uncharacterized protein B0H64DRAFT_466705 [Chaetomium fimeti]|uniref:TNT domain-containing protein n=1 Tax=Chaetomium fimeti TaxID=1854472 RepID=A0AAE0H8Y3_9PEZI|nr:hypothetical protein B0H64DRAFT_466705 [Chaetomium fimeti]
MKLTLLLPTILTLLTPLTTAQDQDTNQGPSCGRRNTVRYCAGTNYTAELLQDYLCGDARLGPTHLPAPSDDEPVARALSVAVAGYDRLGGLCPGAFLERWYDDETASWRYPPQDGFLMADPEGGPQAGVPGLPIRANVTLAPETLLDRFGSEWGSFVSPVGAPFVQRALPPGNLVAGDPEFPYNYHVYSVVKPLVVSAGPIAAWFGQAGAGVQYKLYDRVNTLITDGYLRREDPSVLFD